MNIVFTRHAKEQMKERGISEDEVVNAIKYPEKTQKVDNVYYVQKKITLGAIEVVYLQYLRTRFSTLELIHKV